MNDLDNKVTDEAVKKGAVLSNLFFDSKENSEEIVKSQLTLLFKKISKEQGVIYGVGVIEPPMKEEYPEGIKYISSGEIKVLTQDLNALIRLVGLYGPVHVEILKPSKVKCTPEEVENMLNESIFITYKLSQHIVRSSFKEEDKVQKMFYIKNNNFREKLIPILRGKNYSIDNCFESKQVLDHYYEKGKFIATFSFNIHGFKEDEIEKRFSEMVDKIKKIKSVIGIRFLEKPELDTVEKINNEISYYSKVKHVVLVCDDISTLFILAFRLGATYVKLNAREKVTIDFMEFQDPINELSQVVYELTSHIIKHKLIEGI